MIGRVGQDIFADHLKASLAGAGVDVSAVHASAFVAHGVALIAVDARGQNQIVVASGADDDLAPADVEAMRRVLRGAAVELCFNWKIPWRRLTALAMAREERGHHDSGPRACAAAFPGTAWQRGYPDTE